MDNKLRVTGSELIQDNDAKLARIKEIAGIKPKPAVTEAVASQNTNRSTLLHTVEGADGNVYGLVQEGSRVYVKQEVDGVFEYIGGVANITEHSHGSYAQALKHLNLHLKEVNSLTGNKEGTEILKKK